MFLIKFTLKNKDNKIVVVLSEKNGKLKVYNPFKDKLHYIDDVDTNGDNKPFKRLKLSPNEIMSSNVLLSNIQTAIDRAYSFKYIKPMLKEHFNITY